MGLRTLPNVTTGRRRAADQDRRGGGRRGWRLRRAGRREGRGLHPDRHRQGQGSVEVSALLIPGRPAAGSGIPRFTAPTGSRISGAPRPGHQLATGYSPFSHSRVARLERLGLGAAVVMHRLGQRPASRFDAIAPCSDRAPGKLRGVGRLHQLRRTPPTARPDRAGPFVDRRALDHAPAPSRRSSRSRKRP